ncbi:MAG: radical SAM protein [Candidatus Aenigmatarchaeota archaeon]
MAGILNSMEHLKFVTKKPKVLRRIVDGYFRTIVLRQRRLRTIDWGITYRCNFRCEMCSAYHLMRNKKNQGKKELTVEQIKSVWEQAKKLGVIHVNLTGGEPMLRGMDELCQIIRNFEPDKFLISMVTNGSLVKEDDIRRLKEAGLDTLQLSLESMDPETHDRIRNHKGSYEKLMDCMKWAKKYGLNICLSAVLTKDNFGEMEKIMDFAKNEGVFFLVNPASSSGAWQGREEKKLTKDHLDKYSKILKVPHVRADTILNFSGKSGCPGGVERIEITAYGEVMTCPHVQISYGNVLQEPLEKIYKRMSNFMPLKCFSPVCKHVFDEDYKDFLIRPIENVTELPISIFEHPSVRDNEKLKKSLK